LTLLKAVIQDSPADNVVDISNEVHKEEEKKDEKPARSKKKRVGKK